ncbi:MAG: extracellular solute-binding protein [Caulobacteraceae bacterium]
MKCRKSVGLIGIICLLAALFSMTGCKPGDSSGTMEALKKNAYTYEAVELSGAMGLQSVSIMSVNSKGEIALFDEEKEKILIIDKKGDLVREIPDTFNGSTCLAYDTGDKLYALLQYYKKNGSEVTGMMTELVIYNGQGQKSGDKVVKEINGSRESFSGKLITKMIPDRQGNLYVRKSDGTVEVLNKSLDSIKAWDRNEYSDISLDEKDNLLLLHKSTGGQRLIQKLDNKTGKVIWEKELKGSGAPQLIYCNRSSGKLYGLENGIVYSYSSEGDIGSRLLDCKELSVLNDIYSFAVDDNEEVYVQNADNGKSNIICFKKQDESKQRATEGNKKKLVVYLRYVISDDIVSNAAHEYENKHPGVDIEINDISGLTMEECMQKLNTELLAKKGPDVILGRFLTNDYKDKGLLVNLEEFINKDKSFNIKDYAENLIDASKVGNELYSIPVDYDMECFLINSKLLEQKGIVLKEDITWEQLYTMVKEANSKPGKRFYMLPKMGHRYLFEEIVYKDIDHYIDRKNKISKFNTGEFTHALELLKRMDKEQLLHPDTDFKTIIHSDGEIAPEDILLIPIQMDSYGQIYSGYGKYYNSFNIIPTPKGLHTDARAVSADSIVISSNSKYKEEAWEFVKLLLSEEVQFKVSEDNNFAVNVKANERSKTDMFMYLDKYPLPKYYRPTDKEMDNLKNIMAGVNKIESYDFKLNELIWNEVEPFMKNEKSAEETAEAVQNKVQLYLEE